MVKSSLNDGDACVDDLVALGRYEFAAWRGARDVEAVGARRQNLELRAHLRPCDVVRLATELEVDHDNRDASRDAEVLGEVTSVTEPGAEVNDKLAARGGDVADRDRRGPAIARCAVAREVLRYGGLVLAALFTTPPPKAKDQKKGGEPDSQEGVAVEAARATHELVFQIPSLELDGKRLQRVVGVRPVRDCKAPQLHTLFWETVVHLSVHALPVLFITPWCSVSFLRQNGPKVV